MTDLADRFGGISVDALSNLIALLLTVGNNTIALCMWGGIVHSTMAWMIQLVQRRLS
ncbi:hypothetical protein [Corynebacterium cystitidis]|uniref:hypothetical protein n=1 Tax=Corynebacterium cystitidis TaxID=35757 RepID=UPI00211EF45D|nr:hypothetical protein [Corynebacterium cystitidis]